MRLIDALMLKRNRIKNGELSITTKKTGTALERRLPRQVLGALAEIGPQEQIRPGYYFWSLKCKADNLTVVWSERIKALNEHLSLKDEDGNPMQFRSHMLRDTFAVELLLAGWPIEYVSHALTHKSIKMTEQYDAPWLLRRKQKRQEELERELSKMGATFTA